MANEQNLIPNSQRSPSEVRENGRKGGIRSGEVRREKADLKRQLLLFLETEATVDKSGNPLTGAELMVKVAAREMAKGNPKFWELIRDTAGFKPIDKVQVTEVDQSVIDEVEAMVLEAEEEPIEVSVNDKKDEA
jgi:hypothetical protein